MRRADGYSSQPPLCRPLGGERRAGGRTLYWNNYQDDPASDRLLQRRRQRRRSGSRSSAHRDRQPGRHDVTTRPSTGLFVADSGRRHRRHIARDPPRRQRRRVRSRRPGRQIEGPEGIAFDPVSADRLLGQRRRHLTRSIGWAKLDGSGAGILNTAGRPVDRRLPDRDRPGRAAGSTGATPPAVPRLDLLRQLQQQRRRQPEHHRRARTRRRQRARGRPGRGQDSTGIDNRQAIDFANLNGTGGGGSAQHRRSRHRRTVRPRPRPGHGQGSTGRNYGKAENGPAPCGFASSDRQRRDGIDDRDSAPVNGAAGPAAPQEPERHRRARP